MVAERVAMELEFQVSHEPWFHVAERVSAAIISAEERPGPSVAVKVPPEEEGRVVGSGIVDPPSALRVLINEII
jgi:hypothetical protein